MAQEDPNRIADWINILRKQIPVARQHFVEWIESVREEPIHFWETPAVRYATYGLSFTLVVWVLVSGMNFFVPPPPPDAQPVSSTADFHVVCNDPECDHHFVIHRKFKFKNFPVDCSKCRRITGMQARKCNTSYCKGRWIAPYKTDDGLTCPTCGGRF